jgi:homospermidine synthase
MVGFGSIGQGVLPLILRHVGGLDPGRITVVTADEGGLGQVINDYLARNGYRGVRRYRGNAAARDERRTNINRPTSRPGSTLSTSATPL